MRKTIWAAKSVKKRDSWKRVEQKLEEIWKEATIQRGLQHRSRGIATVGAITGQLLVKTTQAGKE
jgi:hypothetical protein